MPVYPHAVVKLLPANGTQPPIVPTEVIFHTAVAKADSLYDYFKTSPVGVESHFYVREDGTVEQYMDTTVRADAQWAGNAHGISIESWDNADPFNTPWTDAQVAALVALGKWLALVHGIPARICTGPTAPGFGWHEQFVEWNQSHHDCPGHLRVAQIPGIVTAIATPVPPTPQPQPEADMPLVLIVGDRDKATGKVVPWWVSDGLSKRTLKFPEEIATLKLVWGLKVDKGTAGEDTAFPIDQDVVDAMPEVK